MIAGNPNFRYFKQVYPFFSLAILLGIFGKRRQQVNNVINFEMYCNIRAHELAHQNKVGPLYCFSTTPFVSLECF